MQFKSQAKVSFMALGDDSFKNDEGEMVDYDFTKVHIQTELTDSENSFGNPFIEYKWGTSDNYREFVKKYGTPTLFDAEITWENIASPNGKSSRLSVMDVKPLNPAKA